LKFQPLLQVEIGGEEAYIVAGGLDADNRFLSSVESWSTRQASSDKVAVLLNRSILGTVEGL
jgi:hypothetical protein